MVTALSGCVIRNLGVAKAIFYLIGNAEMGWEFQIMGSEQSCFLRALGQERSALPFLCSAVLQSSVQKPRSWTAQEPSPVLREISPEGSMSAAAWLCG